MGRYRFFVGIFCALCISVFAGCSISFSDSEVFLIDESTLQIETKYYPADKLFDEIRDVAGFAVSSDLEIPTDRVSYSYDEIDIREFLFELFGEQDIAFYSDSMNETASNIRSVFVPNVQIKDIVSEYDAEVTSYESEVLGTSFLYPQNYSYDGCNYHYYGSEETTGYPFIWSNIGDLNQSDECMNHPYFIAPYSIGIEKMSFSENPFFHLKDQGYNSSDFDEEVVFTSEDRLYYFFALKGGGGYLYTSSHLENDNWYLLNFDEDAHIFSTLSDGQYPNDSSESILSFVIFVAQSL